MKLFVKFVHEYFLITFYINNKFEGTRHAIAIFESRYMINFNVKTGPQPLAFVWRETDERRPQTFDAGYAKQRFNYVAWWPDSQVIDGKALEMTCLGGARCFCHGYLAKSS